jgi:hypothetical protein
VYVINGLQAIGDEVDVGFAPDGLHRARQDGAVSLPRRAAVVGRIELARRIPGLSIGTSMYYGDAGFESADGDGDVAVPTTIWEGHAQYRLHGFDVAALYASARVGSAAAVNAARSRPAGESIGERLSGYYLQGGYNVLEPTRTGQRLLPYLRYERVNTQESVPGGYDADAEHDQRLVVLGAQWQPATRLAFEADHQWRYNRGASGLNRFNVALALLF